MASWRWTPSMGEEELLTEVTKVLDEITEDQSENSDVGGDSGAEDQGLIPHSSRSSSSRATEIPSASSPAGLEENVELSYSDDIIADNDYIPNSKACHELSEFSCESSTDSGGENSDRPSDVDYHWSKKGSVPKEFTKANAGCSTGIGIKTQVDISSPLKIFLIFLSNVILQNIVNESNLYAPQHGVTLDLAVDELKAFLGLLIIMCFHSLLTTKLYWSTNLNFYVPRVASNMPLKRFLKILRYIHLNDNSKMPGRDSPLFDKLYKIRPLVNHLNNAFHSAFSPARYLSIDESMIGFKGRTSLKQYMPMKPIKRGFKVWAICCAASGYLLGFQIYEGKSKSPGTLGLSERVVLELSEAFQFLGYCMFFDSFFTSIALLSKLLSKGLFACGTLRQTRKHFPKSYLCTDKSLKPGESDYVTSSDISVCKWKDRGTKCVVIGSNMHNAEDKATVLRTNKQGIRETIACPQAIADYNKYMGGVDRFDQLHASYSIAWKSRRWWIKIFYYLIDACVVNSYILYKTTLRLKDPKMKPISHLDFRSKLADELIGDYCGKSRRGPRPYMEKQKGMKKSTLGRPVKTPISLGNVGEHLPVPGTWRRYGFCSTSGKQKRSNLICKRCEVALCKQCFTPYHSPRSN